MKQVYKIVLTGGPCAGKSTAKSWAFNYLTKLGYTVVFIDETATQMITGGITPWGCLSGAHYQIYQMKMQLAKENIFQEAVQVLKDSDKVVILCDRGALDNKAYMTKREFQELLDMLGLDEVTLMDRYDAVMHLVTAAKGAEEFYTNSNNEARTETVEQARELDDKLIAAWTGHPHLRVIDNSSDFEDKMSRLLKEIASFLGEPEPYEIERKYLIEYPDLYWLENNPTCNKVNIVQTYLNSNNPDEEIRIRQRGIGNNYVYFETRKRTISGIKRVETERRISEKEYISLLANIDTSRKTIKKTRYCMVYENQYFEIDIYPFWNDKAIVEIELSDENERVKFPKQFRIIKEVTDDKAYKNASLAKVY